MTAREPTCEVCEGHGTYPVINKYSTHLYDIPCPECFGSGKAEEPDPGPEYEHPPSTAARIQTQEDLRAWMERQTS